MTIGYRKQMKRVGKGTDIYLYEVQSKDHHYELDLMAK